VRRNGNIWFTAGTTLTYTFAVANTGNVKLRGLQLLVPAFAGNSSDDSIVCTYAATPNVWTAGSDLAANSSMSCSGSFSFSQDAIEAGHISPDVSAAAANRAATVTSPLRSIAVPNNPTLAVTIDANSCQAPNNAGTYRSNMLPGCLSRASMPYDSSLKTTTACTSLLQITCP
jgi:hypothetical protein